MIDINLDECTTAIDKIILNSKIFNHAIKAHFSSDYNIPFATIKCYKSLPSITSLEIKGRNIIKIHKTIFLNLINLTSIDLSENKLVKISKNFKLFTNLKTLKLNNNQITFIPSFIGELKQLEHFSLSKNFINSIPTCIQELTKLKYFDISSNKIENIPIELGLLNSLNVLYIDCNYFTKIPTTLCYLTKLNELSFDWLEFVNPPYYKNIKESIGKIIISFILKIFQNMLKKGILFCDFKMFVEEMSIKKSNNENNNTNGNNNDNTNAEQYDSLLNRSGINNELKNSQFCGSSVTVISNNDNNISNNKFLKIFNAIESGYYGVIKSMLEGENAYEYLTVKNIENRTPLNYCMTKNSDLVDLFLSKIKEQKIEINHTYLFKAIKMRNPELVKKLIYLGSKVDSYDDQGKNVLHVLLSVFNKNISKCILIGNFLLSFNLNLNQVDNEGWGPIHFAAKRGCKECLLWIIEKNKKFRKEGKEVFDLNLKGKNDWTPLHLAIYTLRIEETMILLEYGCDIFARNIEGKTPKQVGIANYVFSKLLSYYEIMAMSNKYNFNKEKDKNLLSNQQNKQKNLIEKISEKKEENVSSSIYDDNIIINNSVTIHSDLFKNSIHQIKENKNKKAIENLKNIKIDNIKQKIKLKKDKVQNIDLLLPLKHNLFNDYAKNNNIKRNTFYKLENKTLNTINQNDNKIMNTAEAKEENDFKNKVAYSTNNIHDNTKNDEDNKTKDSLEQIKDKLLYIENSNLEGIQYLTEIKLNEKYYNLNLIKNILENIVNENPLNYLFISDFCNYSTENCLYGLIPTFKYLLTTKIINNKNFIKKEIEHTIKILELLEKTQKNYKSIKTNEKPKNQIVPINKKLSDKSVEKNNTFIKNIETNDFEDLEKNIINFDEMFQKTEAGFKNKNIIKNGNIDNNSNNNKINLMKDIKLSKGNIINIDIKKIKLKEKIKGKTNNNINLSFNKIKKIKAIKSKIKNK